MHEFSCRPCFATECVCKNVFVLQELLILTNCWNLQDFPRGPWKRVRGRNHAIIHIFRNKEKILTGKVFVT